MRALGFVGERTHDEIIEGLVERKREDRGVCLLELLLEKGESGLSELEDLLLWKIGRETDSIEEDHASTVDVMVVETAGLVEGFCGRFGCHDVDVVDPGEDITKTDNSLVEELLAKPLEEVEHKNAQVLVILVRETGLDDAAELLTIRESGDPDLSETVSEGRREFLLSKVSSRVHRGHQSERLKSSDLLDLDVASLGRLIRGRRRRRRSTVASSSLSKDKESIRLENTVETLKDRVFSKGDFIDEDEVSISHGLHKRSILPLKE